MTRIGTIAAILAFVPLCVAGGQSALAAPPSAPVAGYAGASSSSVAGCPAILWRLARHEDGSITGIVYYSDMSGVSTANGTVNSSGQFHIQLTSSMGNGPVGTVDGEKVKNKKGFATMKGEGCANMHMTLNPIYDMKRVPVASQMG